MQRHLSTGSTILATLMAAQRCPPLAAERPLRQQAPDTTRLLTATLTQNRQADRAQHPVDLPAARGG